MIARIVIATLVALLATCQPRWTYVRETGASLSSRTVCLPYVDARPELEDAVHAWAYALRGYETLAVGSGPYCSIDVAEIDEADVMRWCSDRTAIGCAVIGGYRVWLVRGRYELIARGVLLHELGHVFGAQHLDGTLMRPRYERDYSCPDVYTMLQVAAYAHEDLTRFSWCVY